MSIVVSVKTVNTPNLMGYDVIPKFAHPDDAGCDVVASIVAPVVIAPGAVALIPTGICVAIPKGAELQVRPRSGLALKHSVTVLNSPGTIDSGYRNEVGVILINHGTADFQVNPGDRIAQLVINKVEKLYWKSVDKLPESKRGMGGFGSTGVANG